MEISHSLGKSDHVIGSFSFVMQLPVVNTATLTHTNQQQTNRQLSPTMNHEPQTIN